MLALAGAAAFALGRRVRMSSFDVLLLAAAGVFAFRARRDLWFLVAAALALLTPIYRLPPPPAERWVWTPLRGLLLVAGLAVVMAVTARQRDLSPANLERKVAGKFPVQAAAFVSEQHYPGPLFNDFNWGGYLIWALPHLPVAIDGRTNLYTDQYLEQVAATWAGAPGWQDNAELAAAGVIIAPVGEPLTALLRQDRHFQLVYEDEDEDKVACVFTRRVTSDE
jgi:hypothetical protein